MAEWLATEREDPVEGVGWDGGWRIAHGTVRDSSDLLCDVAHPFGNSALQDEYTGAFEQPQPDLAAVGDGCMSSDLLPFKASSRSHGVCLTASFRGPSES